MTEQYLNMSNCVRFFVYSLVIGFVCVSAHDLLKQFFCSAIFRFIFCANIYTKWNQLFKLAWVDTLGRHLIYGILQRNVKR